jgi:hypothetical protein
LFVLLVLVAQIVVPGLLALILAERSEWSRRKIVLVAALPIPILMWGAALILLTVMLFASGQVCDTTDGCSGPAVAAAVTAVVGGVLYALGALFALVGLQLRKQPPKEDLDNIFK